MTRLPLDRVAFFARRRYRAVFLVTAVLVGLSLALAARLRFDTDVLALLPKDDPAVNSFREALEEFGSVDYLLVAVRVPEGVPLDPYESYVDRLGEALAGLDAIDEVEYRIGELEHLLEAFLPKALLFLDPEGLDRIAERLADERLRERAMELRRTLGTPQSLVVKSLLKLDPFGVAEVFLDRLITSRGGLALDWSSGYYLSRDHRMLLILAKPSRPPQDVDFTRALVASVGEELAALEPEWEKVAGPDPPAPPEVVLGGRYVIATADDSLIRRDVAVNLLTSMAGVLLLFLVAFRRFGLLVYAFVPLVCGLALTFGLSAATYGALSAATSGVAALLIGLGIDFVIVSYGRYVEERRGGASLEDALAAMSGSSGRAVVVGGVTSAATFYSFAVTDFTGLLQMGILTGTGILFCMLAVLFLLPAMLAWSEDRHARRRRVPRLVLHGMGSARLIRFSFRRPRAVLAAAALVTVAAGASALSLEFVDSIAAMRPRGNPGVEVREEVANRFEAGFDQMMLIVRGASVEEAVERADDATGRAARLVEEGVLVGADGVTSVLPPAARQRRVLEWLERARADRLDMERVRTTFDAALTTEGLRAAAFADGVELFADAVARSAPLGIDELAQTPEAEKLLQRYLRRDEDGWKSVVYLHPPAGLWRREPPPQVVELARELGPGATLTGANVVSEVLRRRVLRDALVASVIGLLAVGLLLWLDYGNLADTALSLAPLTVGIVWMLGAMAALDLSMNFMNIFVSTMIIGIGVDYGVHMIHRYRELGGAKAARLEEEGLVETGKAIVLAALSTIVGFGSLATSHYPGLASMGTVAILGAVASALVAISVLPAYFSLRRPRASRSG